MGIICHTTSSSCGFVIVLLPDLGYRAVEMYQRIEHNVLYTLTTHHRGQHDIINSDRYFTDLHNMSWTWT